MTLSVHKVLFILTCLFVHATLLAQNDTVSTWSVGVKAGPVFSNIILPEEEGSSTFKGTYIGVGIQKRIHPNLEIELSPTFVAKGDVSEVTFTSISFWGLIIVGTAQQTSTYHMLDIPVVLRGKLFHGKLQIGEELGFTNSFVLNTT